MFERDPTDRKQALADRKAWLLAIFVVGISCMVIVVASSAVPVTDNHPHLPMLDSSEAGSHSFPAAP